jgi:hypothetical protein
LFSIRHKTLELVMSKLLGTDMFTRSIAKSKHLGLDCLSSPNTFSLTCVPHPYYFELSWRSSPRYFGLDCPSSPNIFNLVCLSNSRYFELNWLSCPHTSDLVVHQVQTSWIWLTIKSRYLGSDMFIRTIFF